MIKIKDHRYAVRLDKELFDKFSKVCKFAKTNKADVVRYLIGSFVDAYFVDAYTDEMKNRKKEKTNVAD